MRWTKQETPPNVLILSYCIVTLTELYKSESTSFLPSPLQIKNLTEPLVPPTFLLWAVAFYLTIPLAVSFGPISQGHSIYNWRLICGAETLVATKVLYDNNHSITLSLESWLMPYMKSGGEQTSAREFLSSATNHIGNGYQVGLFIHNKIMDEQTLLQTNLH